MMRALQSYKNVLVMGKEKVSELLVPVRVHKAQKKGEFELAKLEEKLATCEATVHVHCTNNDLDFDALLRAQDDCALAERRIKMLKTLMAQLFP